MMKYFCWRCDKCKRLQLSYKSGNNMFPFKCKFCGATKPFRRRTKNGLHYSVLAVFDNANEARAWLNKTIMLEIKGK